MSDETIRFSVNQDDTLSVVEPGSLLQGNYSNNPDLCNCEKYHWDHHVDENLYLRDYYVCTGCGETAQVG